jgi:hypothetical protein
MRTVREGRADRLIKKHQSWNGFVGWKLRKSRSYGEKSNLGDYHIVDSYFNTVVYSHLDIDKLRIEAETIEDAIERLRLEGRKCAAGEHVPFKLTYKEIFHIIQYHLRESKGYHTTEIIRHYERLMASAVVWCNRQKVLKADFSLFDALTEVDHVRSATKLTAA